MALQPSAVLEEYTLQWVVTGHRWFGKELGCHVSTLSLAEAVDLKIEVTDHTCTTSGSNKLSCPYCLNIKNHIYPPII